MWSAVFQYALEATGGGEMTPQLSHKHLQGQLLSYAVLVPLITVRSVVGIDNFEAVSLSYSKGLIPFWYFIIRFCDTSNGRKLHGKHGNDAWWGMLWRGAACMWCSVGGFLLERLKSVPILTIPPGTLYSFKSKFVSTYRNVEKNNFNAFSMLRIRKNYCFKS